MNNEQHISAPNAVAVLMGMMRHANTPEQVDALAMAVRTINKRFKDRMKNFCNRQKEGGEM